MKTLIADKFSETHLARLSQLGCEVTYKPNAKAEELPGLIGPYKILVVRGKQVTAETIKASDQLALVLRAGAGVNTIDVKTASARGVFVTNCPGKNSIAVAELVFALLLAIDRRIADNVAALRAGINIEEVQNVIFEGAAAASCRVQLDAEPGPGLLAALKNGNPDILGLELLRIGD